MQNPTTLRPENMVTLSRQCWRGPSSGHLCWTCWFCTLYASKSETFLLSRMGHRVCYFAVCPTDKFLGPAPARWYSNTNHTCTKLVSCFLLEFPVLGIHSFAHLLIGSSFFCSRLLILKSNCERFALIGDYERIALVILLKTLIHVA